VTAVAVIVPVLDRPRRVRPTLHAFNATAPARVLFVAEPDDRRELRALRGAGAEHLAPGGNYAQKIAAGIAATDEPYVFTAADDLEPLEGWFEAALAAMHEHGAQAVGVNDLIQRGRVHATHFLLSRAYAEEPTIDGQPGPFFAGYWHWCCDDELIATARFRGVYAYAPEAKVRHLHPLAGLADDDDTYRRGRLRWREDRKLFQKRRRLWRPLSVSPPSATAPGSRRPSGRSRPPTGPARRG